MHNSASFMGIHEWFEHYASTTPDKIACVFGNSNLTYFELNCRANFLAHLMIERGVSPGDVVAVAMTRSLEQVVAILAVLKAGAAYLPLDATLSESRTHEWLEHANIKYTIVDQQWPVNIVDNFFREREYINTADSELFMGRCEQNPAIPTSPERRAYVMYTRNSMGKPKAVMVPHRAVTHLVKNAKYIDFSSQDTLLQFSPLSHDASTFEIWGAWLNGGKLVLYPGRGINRNLLAKVISDNGVSVCLLTATLFNLVAKYHSDMLKTLRVLVVEGEMQPELVKSVLEEYPLLTFVTGYGPTENTAFTCCYSLSRENDVNAPYPIGKPIGETQLHILDSEKRPVMPGFPGELYISGPGVALGYLNTTSDDFFVDPSIAEGLIYRTGDMVTQNAAGDVSLIKCCDDPIKLRGYHVSLKEMTQAVHAYRG
ncbi:AMP-binding protein [Alteromonas ponticola]|uniref:AMP-binding protein n=1 Tax=Alteromonas aquimaris TaxID=2998417 RepID=A0ABT3PAX6_9ALTE|nr:AMP-binding protein [Alteromonas aquimaris]MCW8109926.1 AMP-binding protein [Alteromonas aquimaris]